MSEPTKEAMEAAQAMITFMPAVGDDEPVVLVGPHVGDEQPWELTTRFATHECTRRCANQLQQWLAAALDAYHREQLTALIDHHHQQEAEADAVGFYESAEFHRGIRKELTRFLTALGYMEHE